MALKTGAIRHYTISLAVGTAFNLATFLIAAGELSAEEDGPYQSITFYGGDSNSTRVIYLGGAGVTATDFGIALDTEESFTLSAGLSANLRLREFWAIGTTADELHVLVVVH